MIILSIDVGLKNLAYCLFFIENKTQYCIKMWDTINLCNNGPMQCGAVIKSKQCSNKAKYTKDNLYYCKIHAKKTPYQIPTPNTNIKKVKKMDKGELSKFAIVHELAYLKTMKKPDLFCLIETYLQNQYFKMIVSTRADEIDIITLGRNMAKHFNKLFDSIVIDCVLIENQISPLAGRMKTIQGMIIQYFIMKNIETIENISSANKLREYIGGKKTSYNERKKISISTTRNILEQNAAFSNKQNIFQNHKKKDDLADSFLQGIWYLKDKNIIDLEK